MVSSPEQQYQRRSSPWLFVLAVILIAFIALIVSVMRALPPPLPKLSSIPSDPMPKVNAHDTFDTAVVEIKDQQLIDEAINIPPVGKPPKGESASDPSSIWYVAPESLKERLVAENQPAIALLRIGLTQSYVNPPVRDIDTTLPYYAGYRRMARLLELQARIQASNRDWNDAATTCLDSIELGEKIQHGSLLIGSLVGIACETIGRVQLYKSNLISHLTGSQARIDALRIAELDKNEIAWADTVREEKWAFQGEMVRASSGPDWQKRMADFLNSGTAPSDRIDPNSLPIYTWRVAMPTLYRDYTQYMEREETYSKLTWQQQIHSVEPDMPKNNLAEVFFPSLLKGYSFKGYACFAEDRLLETSLALRAYEADHGAYPASLTQLVPAYLPSAPIDPFTDSQPLKYKLDSAHYILYSVGPDAVDDGGKPIDNTAYYKAHPLTNGTAQSSRLLHSPFTDPNAKGDIVAGVNDN